MATRLPQVRRAFSLLYGNYPKLPSFKGLCGQLFASSNALLGRNDFSSRSFQTRRNSTLQTDTGVENQEAVTAEPNSESASATLPISTTKDHDVKHKVVSNLKVNSRHDFMMIFTCKVCETRSVKTTCRESYEKGIVVARCPGCNNLHLIADRLGWFGEPGSIEDFLSARGEEVKRDSLDSLNITLEDLSGRKT